MQPSAPPAKIVAELFGPVAERAFAVYYRDGMIDRGADRAARCTFVLRSPQALRWMLLPPSELAFAEAYLRDDVDVIGDMEAAVTIALGAVQLLASPRTLARLARLALQLPSSPKAGTAGPARSALLFGRAHSPGRDIAAIRHHYDVANDFYRLWLDQCLVYSCGYFETEAGDLDTAQAAKLEHICRKLRLSPGERLLDIGCGWGALILYAAERQGVEACGITISQEQATLARARIAAAGLSSRCRVEVCDYRDIPDREQFDKIASVGMIEHVGQRQFPVYFGHAYRSLRPGGLLLNQGIVRAPVDPAGPPGWLARNLCRDEEFIQRYVFPDGELVPLAHVVDAAEQFGFETRDVESLREHYALTLRRWVQRLEANHEAAVALVGEGTYRVWRLYMAASAHQFSAGRTNLTQVLFSKPGRTGRAALPLTRRDLYAPQPHETRSNARLTAQASKAVPPDGRNDMAQPSTRPVRELRELRPLRVGTRGEQPGIEGSRAQAWTWLDDRLGLSALRYCVPAHPNTLWYTLGGVTFLGIVVLVVTGAWLAQYYNPDPFAARETVLYIQNLAPLGDVVRGIHIWASYLVVLTAALHLIRIVATASYKVPREVNWLVGLALLAVLLFGALFSGTVLRWDQEAYEAMTHNMELTSLLGALGGFFSPAFTTSVAMLPRLYSLHASIVPLLLALLLIVHFFMIKHHGISPTPEEADAGLAPAGRLPVERETGHYPTHLRLMRGYGLALLGLAGMLRIVFPQGIGPAPDPTIEVTKPPFVFYWLYPFENWFGVRGILYAGVSLFELLAALPLLDRTPLRRLRGRPVAAMVGGVLLLAVLALSVMTALAPTAGSS